MYLSINNSLTQAGFKLTDTQLVIARDGQGFRFKCRDWSIDTNTAISLVKRSRKSRPSLPIAADLSSSTHMSLLDTPTVRVGDATPRRIACRNFACRRYPCRCIISQLHSRTTQDFLSVFSF